jgi:hypothetical protein
VKNDGQLKVLHLSFHLGCIKDFEEIARELELDLTSWYLLGQRPLTYIDGKSLGNEIYNVTAERAHNIWGLHKDFFNQFDVVLTSDTAPLSRIFLQSDWQKPLLIWVCNRFDYAHFDGLTNFPDHDYYRLFQMAADMPNVRVIPYTNYEWLYAHKRGIHISHDTIRPIGSIDDGPRHGTASLIPDTVAANETLFIYPRLTDHELAFAMQMCHKQNISCYCGRYNGPGELAKYKAVLYFPYAWSNVALYENLHRGIIHFVPSRTFIKKSAAQNAPVRALTIDDTLFEFCEWYNPEYQDIFVYFDSWEDLGQKFNNLDYASMQSKIKAFGARHRAQVMAQWREMFAWVSCYQKVAVD